jgi:hypothetical protein
MPGATSKAAKSRFFPTPFSLPAGKRGNPEMKPGRRKVLETLQPALIKGIMACLKGI